LNFHLPQNMNEGSNDAGFPKRCHIITTMTMTATNGGASSFSDHATQNVMVRTTEGWMELFLATPEKLTFSHWKEEIKDKSLTHRMTRPIFEYLATFLPANVAPNVVALFGPLSLGQAWYLTNIYGDSYPTACTWVAVVFIIMFFVTNSITNIHADRTQQRTALGELFKYSCDAGATVFLSVLTTYCLGGTSVQTQWYAVQIAQLVLFLKHLSAFHRNAGLRYNVLTGPGEVILMAVTLLAIRATLGLEWFLQLYETIVYKLLWNPLFEHTESSHLEKYRRDPSQVGSEAVMYMYYTIYLIAVVKSLLLKKPHGWSRFGLSASLLMRFVPAVLFHLGLAFEVGVADVICDGFFMAVLTSDVTLAKMAGRELHPWVILMSMATILSHSTILTLCILYYISVFADLCSYLNMPLLTTCRNVYSDGIYDLCHIGHKLLFQNALQHGNRLFVGVIGDEDASKYKRPPIMTHAERSAEVGACKAVTKVIPNAPCFGLTREFLQEHSIHIVAYGQEYLERYPDPKDDPYYRVPREMGIARPLPRTLGFSTSDLIRRIQQARPADEKKSPT
jgi:cytidyltransferase-like protein